MSQPVLEVKGLHAFYGKSHILHGVSLAVGSGEVAALVGRNGVGKTTTLRSIMGLTPPRSGQVRLLGEEVTRLPAHLIPRRGIGYVPQGRRIFPEFSVLENLKAAVVRGRLSGEALEKVLGYFPALGGRLAQRGGSLSGGEQQMLAVARVLVTAPRLILMDEPTEGLMPTLVALMREIIEAIRRDGVSVLLVEQNLELALAVSQRVSIMERGAIVWEGSAQALGASREVQLRHLGAAV